MTRSGCRGWKPANPVRGVRATVRFASAVRSTRLAWGVSDLVTGGPGGFAAARRGADSRKAPRMKSSTMNGPQGLASESQRRRCQTAKNFVARGTRELASSARGNRGPGPPGSRKLWWGDPHIRDEARGVTPTSDVTAGEHGSSWTESIANLGRTSGVGRRVGPALGGAGFENPESGSVRQVGVEVLESGLRADERSKDR